MDAQTDPADVPQTDVVEVVQPTSFKIYAYGSAECDQFYIEDEENESKRPVDLTSFFTAVNRKIFAVACGGLHTVVLTNHGEVYTFGCNDDGALGREGDEKQPAKVDLPIPVNMISAGDSHSVACNSVTSTVYHWGVYRNVHKGNISKSEKPHVIGESEFARKKITKVLSGAHHTMVLADGKIFAWGDSDAGILGRVPTARRKHDQGLKIEGMGIKGNVEDIYTGAYHSFLKKSYHDKEKNETYSTIFAWGNNNCGQLGIGMEDMFTAIPVEIVEFRRKNIVQITGGEHHTVALAENGDVYSFGKNDDGQLGLGEDYIQTPSRKSSEIIPEEDKKEGDAETKTVEVKIDRTETKFVSRPKKVNIADIATIGCGASYNYAISKSNEIFSWGMGDNYVLGTREEDTAYEPTKIDFRFFKVAKLHQLALGAQHVVFVGVDDASEELKIEVELKAEEKKPEDKKAAKPKKEKAAKEEKKGKKEKKEAEDKEEADDNEAKDKEDKEEKDDAEAEDKSEKDDEKVDEEKEKKPEKKKVEKKKAEKKPVKKESDRPKRGRSTKKVEEEVKSDEKVEEEDAEDEGSDAESEEEKKPKGKSKSKKATSSSKPPAKDAKSKRGTTADKKEKTNGKSKSKSKSKSPEPARTRGRSTRAAEKEKVEKDTKADKSKKPAKGTKDDKSDKKVHEAKKRKAEEPADDGKNKRVKKNGKK